MLRLSLRNISSSAKRSATNGGVSYSKTLQLPKTTFGPKLPNAKELEKLIEKSSTNLYKWQLGRPESEYDSDFILHDGPPYANGDLHLGHALNKICKDVINRFELIYNNKRVKYQPGWDCHGLPIEMKAITSSSDAHKLSAVEIRKLCRELAMSMIDKQRDQFTNFAVMTDFEKPYVTLQHKYEVSQLKIFQKLMENGLLSRQQKPVWWGCETETALAEAELEYNNGHISTAVYVKYPLHEGLNVDGVLFKNVNLLIWTSTPWTLPANKAICINRNLTYTLLHNKETNEHILVGEGLAEGLLKTANKTKDGESDIFTMVDVSIPGESLVGLNYTNPIIKSGDDAQTSVFPVLHGDHVTATAGTGLVHTAPAHGGEDYLIGRANGLEIISLVDSKGKFHGLGIPLEFQFLKGESHSDCTWKIIDLFKEESMIFKVNKKFKHSYPYDWRSGKPVIQRATPQWFINVDKIKDAAVESLELVKFFPETGRNRLLLFIKNRNEWCISRQRVWGVPLPIIYDKLTGEPIENLNLLKHIVNMLDQYGTDEWFVKEDDISRWLPEEFQARGKDLVKGKDTMDVWFDSGTSWTQLRGEDGKDAIADLYLEGSDQHRGWFQSSLLNKIISSGVNGSGFKPIAPFKEIITHGFTLDSKNNKMSKSKGNVISPLHAMQGGGKPFLPALGTDGLRLWAASSNYTQDVNVTLEVLTRVFDNMKKLRITLKYLLGNLNGFETPISYEKLNPLDKYILSKLYTLQSTSIENYKEHNFQRVVKDVSHFISTDLSSSYFDISKDCLYTDGLESHKRKCIQTVLDILLRTQVGLLAPIQPILTQEVWNNYAQFSSIADSPFMVGNWERFYKLPEIYSNQEIEQEFEHILNIKSHLYKCLEQIRKEANIKSNLELSVEIQVSGPLSELLHSHQEFLEDYFLVSNVSINHITPAKRGDILLETSLDIAGTNISLIIKQSPHEKCPRCWKFTAPSKDELCGRCESVVN